MSAGEIEHEFGVPIPGKILPQAQWARTGLKRLPEPGPLDWEAIFGREAPVVLELGCGNGRFTLQSALARPELDHFAIDVLPVVIRYATRRGNQRGLHHVRFAVKDAQTFLASYVGEASVAEVHLYHPQPYHDPRQAHRRVITPRFLAEVHRGAEALGALRGPDRQSRLLGVHDSSHPPLLRVPGSGGPLAGRPGRPVPPRDRGSPARATYLPRPGHCASTTSTARPHSPWPQRSRSPDSALTVPGASSTGGKRPTASGTWAASHDLACANVDRL